MSDIIKIVAMLPFMVKVLICGPLGQIRYQDITHISKQTRSPIWTCLMSSLFSKFEYNTEISTQNQKKGSKNMYFQITVKLVQIFWGNCPSRFATPALEISTAKLDPKQILRVILMKRRDFKLWWRTFQKNKHAENLKVSVCLSADLIAKYTT